MQILIFWSLLAMSRLIKRLHSNLDCQWFLPVFPRWLMGPESRRGEASYLIYPHVPDCFCIMWRYNSEHMEPHMESSVPGTGNPEHPRSYENAQSPNLVHICTANKIVAFCQLSLGLLWVRSCGGLTKGKTQGHVTGPAEPLQRSLATTYSQPFTPHVYTKGELILDPLGLSHSPLSPSPLSCRRMLASLLAKLLPWNLREPVNLCASHRGSRRHASRPWPPHRPRLSSGFQLQSESPSLSLCLSRAGHMCCICHQRLPV